MTNATLEERDNLVNNMNSEDVDNCDMDAMRLRETRRIAWEKIPAAEYLPSNEGPHGKELLSKQLFIVANEQKSYSDYFNKLSSIRIFDGLMKSSC
ncbi:hypothetical protein CEXT_155261 [Caerostris extrusa]|uniref:Uncharacterized protein n=1 Tax=Caerostris extrusa TaxID=172846 RepID=A0AAV4Y864_CAEEX|nr:hypothetical protein CEXT_155261 [Caerostris extrusa]